MDITNFFVMSINLAAVFIFGSTGESITEKSGHLNMGIPGIACLGFCGSVLGANIYLNSGADNIFLAYLSKLPEHVTKNVAFTSYLSSVFNISSV